MCSCDPLAFSVFSGNIERTGNEGKAGVVLIHGFGKGNEYC
jgi:hypothetical protein